MAVEYLPHAAHPIAASRWPRLRARKVESPDSLRTWVEPGLRKRWSPDQISQRLHRRSKDTRKYRDELPGDLDSGAERPETLHISGNTPGSHNPETSTKSDTPDEQVRGHNGTYHPAARRGQWPSGPRPVGWGPYRGNVEPARNRNSC